MCLQAHLSVCLSVTISVLFVCVSKHTCLSVCLSVTISVLFVCISEHTCLSVCPSHHFRTVCVSLSTPVCLSVCPSHCFNVHIYYLVYMYVCVSISLPTDEYITMKQMVTFRFQRNHRLMAEIFNDLLVPNSRTGRPVCLVLCNYYHANKCMGT